MKGIGAVFVCEPVVGCFCEGSKFRQQSLLLQSKTDIRGTSWSTPSCMLGVYKQKLNNIKGLVQGLGFVASACEVSLDITERACDPAIFLRRVL